MQQYLEQMLSVNLEKEAIHSLSTNQRKLAFLLWYGLRQMNQRDGFLLYFSMHFSIALKKRLFFIPRNHILNYFHDNNLQEHLCTEYFSSIYWSVIARSARQRSNAHALESDCPGLIPASSFLATWITQAI